MQPQTSAITWQTVLNGLAILLASFIGALVGRRRSTSNKENAEARHLDGSTVEMALERIDKLYKIIEVKDAQLLRLRAVNEEVQILTSWNTRMRATLKAHNIPVPDKWQSGETRRSG